MTDLYQQCSKCVCDTVNYPNIKFDEEGHCSHCHVYQSVENRYPRGQESIEQFEAIVEDIIRRGKGNTYDCVIGVSGGADSSYLLLKLKSYGLRILAVHFDNGWVNEVASENIKRIVNQLEIDLEVVRIDKSILYDGFKSFIKASVREVCAPCSIGVLAAIYKVAAEKKIKYIVYGHNFRKEGVVPVSQVYWDQRYFNSVIKKFGKFSPKDYLGLSLVRIFYYTFVKRIKTVSPMYYLDPDPVAIQKELEEKLQWKDGGGAHFDCNYKDLVTYIHESKFHFNINVVALSAQINRGKTTKADALKILEKKQPLTPKIQACLRKMDISDDEFEQIMQQEQSTYKNYPNNSWFPKLFKFPIYILVKLNILNEMTYERFTQ